jgi:hypothetical protein
MTPDWLSIDEAEPPRRRKKPPPEPRPLSPDDVRDTDIRRACAKALAGYMKGLNLSRPFRSLTRPEAEAMAQAVISEWVVQASRRVAAEPEANVELKHWLMGG